MLLCLPEISVLCAPASGRECLQPQEAFVLLTFPAWDAMQIDWGEASVYIYCIKTVANLLCAQRCFSVASAVRHGAGLPQTE